MLSIEPKWIRNRWTVWQTLNLCVTWTQTKFTDRERKVQNQKEKYNTNFLVSTLLPRRKWLEVTNPCDDRSRTRKLRRSRDRSRGLGEEYWNGFGFREDVDIDRKSERNKLVGSLSFIPEFETVNFKQTVSNLIWIWSLKLNYMELPETLEVRSGRIHEPQPVQWYITATPARTRCNLCYTVHTYSLSKCL